ncbi:MAG: hypothetical protein COZ94_07535 [Nitrospirae bacterium CG_4_8_14_3_um_filter_41_47]|nr:MAG: hypothetical protein COZ94_07535 [Nitrospirae bacterium CG_4_8_14_3_um_filter_41_47]
MIDETAVKEVQEIADQYKKELGGVLSPALIIDSFQRDKIITVKRGLKVVGFLIHGSMKESAVVVSYTATHKSFERQNIGTLLVDRLIQKAREANVAYVVANVREDLPANKFWQKMGFAYTHCKRSSNKRGKQLYSYRLCLRNLFGEESPRFNPYLTAVLDTNQIISLLENRKGRNLIEKLFKAFFENKIRLMISDEFNVEAQRAERSESPLLTFVRTLEVVTTTKDEKFNRDVENLMGTLFPGSAQGQKKYNQNLSDCRHLVACAREKITYFITHDGTILSKGMDALNTIGLNLQIVTPDVPLNVLELRETFGFAEPSFIPYSCWKHVRLNKIDNRSIPIVVDFFDDNLKQVIRSGIEYSNKSDPWWKTQILYLEKLPICGYVLHNDTDNFRMTVYPVIFERQLHSQPFFAYLIQDLVFTAIYSGTREIDVHIISQSRELVEPVLNFMGFLQTKNSNLIKWRKFLVKRIVTPSNFLLIAKDVIMPPLLEHEKFFFHNRLNDSDVKLSADAVETSKVIELKGSGEGRLYSISDLEHIFFPMLFWLQSRTAVIIPIKPLFANELIPGKQDPTLFNPEYGKLLRFDNVYFSGSNALNLVKAGTPIVFYSSAPEKKAIATAKIIEATVDSPDVIARKYQNLGAFDIQEIKATARRNTGRVMAIRFHWTMPFKNLISLKQLRQIYERKGHRFVAPQCPMMMPFDIYLEILKITGVY